MSGLCKDCRWWKPFEPGEPYHDRDLNHYYEGWGECELAEMKDGAPKHERSRAVGVDGERYVAGLVTAPDFGCGQFSGRAEKV